MPNLRECSDSLLSVTTIADLSVEDETTLYIVPVDKTCILTKALLKVDGDVGNTADVSIGQNGAETDFIPSTDLDIANAASDVILLAPIPSATPTIARKEYTSGEYIKFDVINAGNAVAATCYLFGIVDDE